MNNRNNGPQKLLFTVAAHEWKKTNSIRRQIKKINTEINSVDDGYGFYVQHEIARKIHLTLRADFDVVIDVPAIIDEIVGRCRQSKSGKSALLGGLATAKRRKNVIELSREVEEIPLREGYEEVKS